MDQIINIFGERKNCESFLFKTLETQVRSVHVILFCYIVLNRSVQQP